VIGNDIIDLTVAKIQSNWQRKGFLNKIFKEEEQAIILGSNSPFQTVWLFWSMKESAYKIYIQKYQGRFFAPKKFRCELISETQGLVLINNERYYTNSKITGGYIFTEAVEVYDDIVEHACFKLINTTCVGQSETMHKKLKQEVSRKQNLPMNTLLIKKNVVGVPKLYKNNKQLQVVFSMSHHGNYGAYSILDTLK